MKKTFNDTTVKRHARAALTILRVRDAALMALDTEALDYAAGHLRAIARATGLAPPKVCDALRIHGWRRRQMMPQTSGGLRFRLSKMDRLATTHVLGFNQRFSPTAEAWAARPARRQSIYRPRDTQELTK